MKYAILSDIHSNLEALEAVLRTLFITGYDRILFLGDLLGYGGSPNECVDLAREYSFTGLLGNHDRAILNRRKLETFNEYARIAVQWTCAVLTDVNREFIKNMPVSMHLDQILMVHGALTAADDYIMGPCDMAENLELLKSQHPESRILFFGHTHIKCFFSDKAPVNKTTVGKPIQLEDDAIYFINPGSVGQPRDGSPLASFGIYDSTACSYEQYTIPYDLKKAQKKILEAGLPAFLADRLSRGR